MNQADLLQDAVFRSASIHQPHSLKAYLAANHLTEKYPEAQQEIWEQTHRLIRKTEIKIHTVLSEHMEAVTFSSNRIQSRVENGVFPAAYLAMNQWHKERGIQDILEHYLEKAATADHYLFHHVTILLAFKAVHQHLNESQIPPYLERLTEFVGSTFNDPKFSGKPAYQPTPPNFDDTLKAALIQPGFFGHNLITIAWLHRMQNEIPEHLLDAMLFNLLKQCTQPLEFPEDALDQHLLERTTLSEQPEKFHTNIQHLLFHKTLNLHQVTLADALTHLWKNFPTRSGQLSQMAEYFGSN
ncbi:hypothetical protein [Endozoicomonas arenosclerae]|uniref:hypothetical protein n=1 Tax=Endozoicomonas arenosclerae TaxID=1633495 RepID=UPI0007867680|nr:hypothetical protein [Endozoicomonas arenosclerae]